MDHMSNELSLRVLRHLVSGEGVAVNINSLSKALDMHRATAGKRVQWLFDNHILDPPTCSFPQVFKEFPLFVLAWADIPRTEQALEFFKDETNIFAAFSCMEGPYNTLLMEFFKDMDSYQNWRERIVTEQKLPSRDKRAPAEVQMFSNNLAFKYNPTCFLRDMQVEFRMRGKVELGGHVMDQSTFPIFQALMKGEHIRVRSTFMAKELDQDSRKISRRVQMLRDDGFISGPRCYFPNLLVPPGHNMIVSLLEVKEQKELVKRAIMMDNHVPRALRISSRRYNMLVLSAFAKVEEFFEWGEALKDRFGDDIGGIQNTILSSKMVHTIKTQKVSLGIIERRLRKISK